MPPHKRSRAELEQELREQMEALRDSAAAFDAGKLWEAKRLASTAYILLHDGGRNCRSLLGQLGLKDELISTLRHNNPDGESPLPLAVLNIDMNRGGQGATYSAFLDEHSKERRPLPFSKWYEEVVFLNGRLSLSRKNIIFTFRSQVGGAHVDGTIRSEAFHWLRSRSQHIIKTEVPGPTIDAQGNEVSHALELIDIFAKFDGPVPNGHVATMRQIAWEIDQSVRIKGY